MGLIYVLIGCIFLVNPSYTLIDVLPDFIGLIFIMYGISKVADLDEHMSVAMGKLKNAFWVALGKFIFLCMIGVFDSTMIITLSLAAGVLECIFLLPALLEMFGGIDYIAMQYSERYSPQKNDLKTLTAIFVILRAAGSFVPNMIAMLVETAGGDVTSRSIDAAQTSMVLNIAFAVATLAAGVVWLVEASKQIRALHSDKAFNEKLGERYKSEILENKEVMLRRKVGRFTLITSMGFIFFITFRIDSVFFMPEFLFGAAVLVALFFAKEYGKNKTTRNIVIAFIAVGAINYAVMMIYSIRYGDLIYPFGAEGFVPFYVAVTALSAATYALLIACSKQVNDVLRKMTRDSVGLKGVYTDERRRDIDSERAKEILRKLTASEVLTCVYAAIGVAVTVAMPFIEAIWLVKFVAGIILFVQFAVTAKEISNEASNAL